jgi:two-component system phosphate regulon sensor histidine kinase PhoR
LVDALPDPVMVISAQEPDDLIGRRFILINASARETFQPQAETGLLVTLIRDPQVLETVDEALFGAIESETLFSMGGAQGRILRAMARPLGEAPDGSRLALLVLRDETDARRAEQTRADFLANASHELRTPLASLSGFIETLRGHAKEDPKARDRFLGIMQGQAERMSRLVDDLMSLSRIEMNEHVPPSDRVDFVAATQDVVDALALMAADRQVSFATDMPARDCTFITGDRDQVIQVIQNLADNALKYSPAGSTIRLAVEGGLTAEQAAETWNLEAGRMTLLSPDRAGVRYVRLRVTDAGVGLAREHLPRLTERFYRVEGQKSGERPGTGLGLAIVKHIVNRHRGGFVVESQEGKGASFTVYFPMI